MNHILQFDCKLYSWTWITNHLNYKIEAIQNCRPLNYLCAVPSEPSALTPGNFLFDALLGSLPQVYRLERWQTVQVFNRDAGALHVFTHFSDQQSGLSRLPLSELETLSLFKNLILHIYNRARSISYFLALIVLCECEAKTPKGQKYCYGKLAS